MSEDGKAVTTTGPSPFEVYANAVSPRTIVGKLLKFAKGDFIAGEGNEVIPESAEFTVLMDESITGWVRWEDAKPVEHRMGRIADNFMPPVRTELGDLDRAAWETDGDGKARDPWILTAYLPMKLEPDGDQLFTFVAASKGAHGAVADLCRQYARHAKKHGEQYPIVRLTSGTYDHKVKAYGKIPFPIFCVIGWTAKSDLAPGIPSNDPDDPIELPF
jgi:hypothetical protein